MDSIFEPGKMSNHRLIVFVPRLSFGQDNRKCLKCDGSAQNPGRFKFFAEVFFRDNFRVVVSNQDSEYFRSVTFRTNKAPFGL